MRTILRTAEHATLSEEVLSGTVIDLGGHPNSEYAKFIRGDFRRVTANLSPDADIQSDFEKPLPMDTASYDAALLINVLEHIFEYRQLLAETHRILTTGARVIIVVPFLFPYHASPEDYHRYTRSALEKALHAAGFKDIRIVALGSGVCAARWLLIERLLPRPLQFIAPIIARASALFDGMFTKFARVMGKKYQPSDYALGFKATATK